MMSFNLLSQKQAPKIMAGPVTWDFRADRCRRMQRCLSWTCSLSTKPLKMLAQARWRASTLHQISRRLYATEAAVESTLSSSTPPPEKPSTKPKRDQGERRDRRRRDPEGTIFIRPWGGVNSMTEAFAIVQGIEKKYGKIRDFKLKRDVDNNDAYQSHFWARFRDIESYNLIPEEATVLQVRVPLVNKAQEGGIGLADLQGLLDSSDRVVAEPTAYQSVAARMTSEKEGEEDSWRLEDVRIERTNKSIYYNLVQEYPNHGKGYILGVGQAFSKWGGFYQPADAPLNPQTEEQEQASEDPPLHPASAPAQTRMRRAQAKWRLTLDNARPAPPKNETPPEEDPEYASAVEKEVILEERLNGAAEPPKTPEVLETTPTPEPEPSTPVVPDDEVTPSVPTPPTSEPQPSKSFAQTLTRRQRILAQAREHARATPSETSPAEEPEANLDAEKKAAEEKDEKVLSVKERLWRLMGMGSR